MRRGDLALTGRKKLGKYLGSGSARGRSLLWRKDSGPRDCGARIPETCLGRSVSAQPGLEWPPATRRRSAAAPGGKRVRRRGPGWPSPRPGRSRSGANPRTEARRPHPARARHEWTEASPPSPASPPRPLARPAHPPAALASASLKPGPAAWRDGPRAQRQAHHADLSLCWL